MCPLHPEPPSLPYPSRFSKSTTLGALPHAWNLHWSYVLVYNSMLFSHFILLSYSPTMLGTNSASEQAFGIGKIQICSAQSSRIIKHQYYILSNDPG